MYGTSVQAVEDVKKGGKMCILDIDTQVSRYLAKRVGKKRLRR